MVEASPVADYNFAILLDFGDRFHADSEKGMELTDRVLAQRSELARMHILLEQAEKAKRRMSEAIE